MSASQQKKLRKQQREEGTEKRQIAQKKIEKAHRRSRNIKITAVAVIAVIVAVVIVFNSTLLYSNFTAVKIGDVSYTAAEYGFFYNSYVKNFESSPYFSYMGIDPAKPYNKQEYEKGKTWADFFKESVLDQMKEITALYEEAQKEGFKLSDSDQAALNSSIENLKSSHEGGDYSNADSYLASVYGKGCNVKVVSSLIEKSYIAQAYAEHKNASFSYSADDIKAYYEQNKDNLDNYTYLSCFIDGTKSSSEGSSDVSSASDIKETVSPSASPSGSETEEELMEKAKSTAEAIISRSDSAEAFKQAVLENVKTEASESTSKGSELMSDYANWLKDSSRKTGDTTVIKSGSGYYALYFISRDNNSYYTVNVRHILIKAVADKNGSYTDEAKAAAKKKAEDLLAKWKSGEATEESFAQLAKENSEDSGSNTKGGLYENVSKGEMVTEFNDWCFAEGRKPGDTGIVYGESGSYSGYHVMYYVGPGKLYRDKLAEDNLRSKDFSEWKTALLEKYDVSTGFTASLIK